VVDQQSKIIQMLDKIRRSKLVLLISR